MEPGLAIDNVTVRFGGLVAVDDLSLDAPRGRITGLIGPNGAGKTTTFNACTGLVTARTGRFRLGETDLTSRPAWRRAQAGLGRTFQRFELFDSLTVAENVGLGVEAFESGHRPWRMLVAGPGDRRRHREQADAALERCGIAGLAAAKVRDLSTGQRRLVELARALATPFRFLLLDEPSSGLDESETEQFGRILTAAVEATGVGILLVEHDMALVRRCCSYLYVLEFGHLITAGDTGEVLASAEVRRAYLGSAATEGVA